MPEIRATADTLKNTGLRNYQLMIPVAAIALMEFVHLTQRRGSVRQMVSERPAVVRWPLYYALVFGIIVFGMFDNSRFIYFQF